MDNVISDLKVFGMWDTGRRRQEMSIYGLLKLQTTSNKNDT